MNRFVLKDEKWACIAPFLPGKAGDPGRSGAHNRLFPVAVLRMGNLAHFLLPPGQRHDSVGAELLLGGIEIGALIADKGFDDDALRQELDAQGTTAAIPPKANRARRIVGDFAMYRWRHLVEKFFCYLK